jgi:hypothetical protein
MKSSDTSTAAAAGARRRAALELRQRIEDLVRRQDLLDGEHLVEQRERVLRRVLARLRGDLRERLSLRAVLPPVLAARAAEHLRGRRRLAEALRAVHEVDVAVERVRAVVPLRRQRALLHLLEAEREHALRARLDRLPRQEQRRRPRRAVVVHVDDRHAGDAERIQRALPARAVAVDVADVRLLDLLRRHAGVLQRVLHRALRHHVVRVARAGLLELDHADAEDVDLRVAHVRCSFRPAS